MAEDRARPAALSREAGVVARGSALNVVAMTVGAVLGFALTVLVSRWLQPRETGALFELIALFTILSNTLELGADTGLTRWISRARAIGGIADVRRIVTVAIVPVLVVGTAVAATVWVAAPALAHGFLHGMDPVAATADFRIVAPLVPLGALSACVLAGARGFGRMWPYLAVEGLGKPALRLGLMLGALAIGWKLQGALIAWSLPVAAGLVVGWLILAGLIRVELRAAWRSLSPPAGGAAQPRPEGPRATSPRLAAGRHRSRGRGQHRVPRQVAMRLNARLAGDFWRFAAPRGLAGTFQIVVIWLDILLVGALVSRYAAGVYAATSKLAVVGTFALEGTRLSIAPQLSALLARSERGRAADLYQSATRWLMLASWPVYVIFAIFPAVVLGIFGPPYTAGAAALVVLSLAMLINLGTGNVTVVLLMSGKSSWNVVNALAALVVNIGLNLILVPRIGITGAAIAWAASIVVDNVAAVIEVWWMLGLAPFGRGYALVVAATAGCFGLTGLAARTLLGETLPGLILATAVGLIGYVAIAYAARARLQLAELSTVFRLRRARPAANEPSQHAA